MNTSSIFRILAVGGTLLLTSLGLYYFTSSPITQTGKTFNYFEGTAPTVLERNNSQVLTNGSLNFSIGQHTKTSPTMTKVLLITYYRGGSSFLGQMFAQNSEAFYWFEPLYEVHRAMSMEMVKKKDGSRIVGDSFQLLHNGSLRALPKNVLHPRTEILIKTLTCKATTLTEGTLSGNFFRTGQGMPRFRSYIHCLGHKSQHKYKICSRTLEETCLNSSIVAVKVIRYPMYDVPELLRILPDLKVVLYFRDPRGIIASRAAIHGWSGGNLASNARYLCLQMAEDLKSFKTLQRQLPTNYLLLKYEELALKPEETAKRIYQFVGHKTPTKLLKWLDENTKAKSMDWTYGTRRNSKATVFNWRKRVKHTNLKIVTDQCNVILKTLDYEI